MGRMMKTSRPMWCDEGVDVETAAVIEIDVEGAEYRDREGADAPDGADPQGMNNNPERKK